MTPYIQQQLKKLCDNPNWYDDMLISWDKNPRNQREAIYNYLSHVNTDTYGFATFDKEATNGEPPYPVIEINRKGLAHFMNDDQGYKSGISMYGHYIACKCLDISSEEEYMNQLTDIRILTNEIKPC